MLLSALFIVLSVVLAVVSASNLNCGAATDCVSCTEAGKYNSCFWCETPLRGGCFAFDDVTQVGACKSAGDKAALYRYDDTCPVKWPSASPYLSNWMGKTMDVIKHLTLLDISLPGTHDTLSYDLSTRVSDGGADDFLKLAEFLYKYTKVIPTGIEDYIRQQAQTQDLDITTQLNNGVRFLDLRMMYEYSDAKNPDWYSLHFMASESPVMKYLTEVKQWMDAHPTEIVVMWLSKHGNECAVGQDQYPNTTIEQKQAYWQKIYSLFADVITDHSVTKIGESTIEDMIARNHRLVIYASDYAELTNNSQYALNGCDIDNQLGPGVSEEINAKNWELSVFSNAYKTKQTDKNNNKFFLMSMATGVPGLQMALAAKLRFLPDRSDEADVMKCASAFAIPGLSWCPETLLDIAQLENYYKQITLEQTIQSALSSSSLSTAMGFPNAIYINAVDVDGTIRSGTQVMWGKERDNSTTPAVHATSSYAYSDTLILYNILLGCEKRPDLAASCASLKSTYQNRRAKHPASYWTNEHLGRLENWP